MKGHEIAVSRLKLVLIVVCLIAIPLTFWLNHRDVGSVNNRVTKVESPCLRYGAKSPQCRAAFEAAVATITHPEACAVERKAGTLRAIRELAAGLDVTFTEPCADARLAQERQRGSERAVTSRKRSAMRSDTGGQEAPPTRTGGPNSGPVRTPSPGKNGSNEAPTPHHPGNKAPPAPPNPGASGEQSPVAPAPAPASAAPSGSEPTSEPTEESGPVKSTLEQTGEAVHTIVCSLTERLLLPADC